MKSYELPEDKKPEDNKIKNLRNLFRLKKEIDDKKIKNFIGQVKP